MTYSKLKIFSHCRIKPSLGRLDEFESPVAQVQAIKLYKHEFSVSNTRYSVPDPVENKQGKAFSMSNSE